MVVLTTEMHARVVIAKVKPGHVEAGVEAVESQLAARLSQVPGYKGYDLLLDDLKAILTTWWTDCPGPGVLPEIFGDLPDILAVLDEPEPPAAVRYLRRSYHRMENAGPLPPID